MIRVTDYGVIAEKPRVGKLGQFVRTPCRKNYTLDRKMDDNFLGTTSSYHHAKFGEDRTTRACCRCENVVFVFFCFYRQDCRVAANCLYCFYSQAKNLVFRPAGSSRCTDSCQTLHDRRAPVSAWPCKISHQSAQGGGNAAPKISKKNFHFFVKSRPVGATPLTDFEIV